MRHDAHGYWIAEAGLPPALPPLTGDAEADVVVVGGGYTGLWTAWHVLELAPDARVVVLEAARCGAGPSGRNGGFVSSLALSAPALRDRHGPAAADAVVAASIASVRAIGAWCADEEVDAWYRSAPHLLVSAAPAQDGCGAGAVDGDEVVALDAAAVRALCASPVLRGGVLARTGATVQPARLAFGLRARVLARGARILEGTRVRALRSSGDGVRAHADGGDVRAASAVLAVNAASGAVAPLRRRLTVGSSHVVVTEPVPDVLADAGWTGDEAISDGRALLHYLRTTPDGRIAFGWAGGRMGAGARTGGRLEVDRAAAATARADLVRFFPALAGRRVAHAWGGPIDVAPTHLPAVASLPGGRAFAAYGYTGNGVGPAHLLGRVLAGLALERRDAHTALALVDAPGPRVPPEPLRAAGAALVRRALVAKEAAEEVGARPGPVARGLSALPARMGVRLVR